MKKQKHATNLKTAMDDDRTRTYEKWQKKLDTRNAIAQKNDELWMRWLILMLLT